MCIINGHLEESYFSDLAELVYEAFEQKIVAAGVPKEVAVEMMLQSIDPQAAFYAYCDGRLAGMAGLISHSGQFFHFRLKTFRQHFGLFRSIFYTLMMGSEDSVFVNELKIAPLAVASDMRGRGIGTKLIGHVERYAREQGYRILSLDVVDTNTGALRLYQKLGFRIHSTAHFLGLTKRAGFSGSHYMQKRIG